MCFWKIGGDRVAMIFLNNNLIFFTNDGILSILRVFVYIYCIFKMHMLGDFEFALEQMNSSNT